MAGRKRGFRMTDEHREKIANSQVLTRLIKFAEGTLDKPMTGPEVTAALGLLDRCLPKLQTVELTGDEDKPVHVTTIERRIVKVGD